MERPLALAGFATQSRREHAATVLAGIAVFAIGYVGGVAVVYGDLSALAVETNVEPQRVGGVVGSVLVWAYFALAFVRGYGSPVGNVLVYPLAVVALVPFAVRWSLFGPDPAGLADRFVGLFVLEPLVTTVTVVVPGVGTASAILLAWAALLSDERRREWERTHLPPAFYEAFVEGDGE